MDNWFDRPGLMRVFAAAAGLFLALAFLDRLSTTNLIQDPGMSWRLAVVFTIWCELIVVCPKPPRGFHIAVSAMFLVIASFLASMCVEVTATYVIQDVLFSDLQYSKAFGLIAIPTFLVCAAISPFTDVERTETGWLSWLVQDARFVFIGTACSILGLILTIWPSKDIVHGLTGGP